MIFKVSSLDEASHTVSPCAGWLDEGSRNGNRLKPAVRMIPVTLSPLAMKARPGRRARERQNAVEGKRVSGRLGLGGRRTINTKTLQQHTNNPQEKKPKQK